MQKYLNSLDLHVIGENFFSLNFFWRLKNLISAQPRISAHPTTPAPQKYFLSAQPRKFRDCARLFKEFTTLHLKSCETTKLIYIQPAPISCMEYFYRAKKIFGSICNSADYLLNVKLTNPTVILSPGSSIMFFSPWERILIDWFKVWQKKLRNKVLNSRFFNYFSATLCR